MIQAVAVPIAIAVAKEMINTWRAMSAAKAAQQANSQRAAQSLGAKLGQEAKDSADKYIAGQENAPNAFSLPTPQDQQVQPQIAIPGVGQPETPEERDKRLAAAFQLINSQGAYQNRFQG